MRCAAGASLVHLALHKKIVGLDIKEAKDFINKYVLFSLLATQDMLCKYLKV